MNPLENGRVSVCLNISRLFFRASFIRDFIKAGCILFKTLFVWKNYMRYEGGLNILSAERSSYVKFAQRSPRVFSKRRKTHETASGFRDYGGF